jgi:creatinine amidohydrolase
LRQVIGDGSFGGRYQRDDEEMLRIWRIGVEEVRELLESGWRRA